MDYLLFSERSIWTMIHGVGLGGGALLGLAAALFTLRAFRPVPGAPPPRDDQARDFARLLVAVAVMLWLTSLAGMYIAFPPYRAAPPEGMLDLAQHPRALLLANPDTAWLHAFGMELKEHVPFLTMMLATAVAFVAVRYRDQVLTAPTLRRMTGAFLSLAFVLVASAALLGVLINKVAPLE
jgi:hypothetical protein